MGFTSEGINFMCRSTPVKPDIEKVSIQETSALVQATGPLHCDKLTLIAFSPTRDIESDGKTIHIISAVDWLLS